MAAGHDISERVGWAQSASYAQDAGLVLISRALPWRLTGKHQPPGCVARSSQHPGSLLYIGLSASVLNFPERRKADGSPTHKSVPWRKCEHLKSIEALSFDFHVAQYWYPRQLMLHWRARWQGCKARRESWAASTRRRQNSLLESASRA